MHKAPAIEEFGEGQIFAVLSPHEEILFACFELMTPKLQPYHNANDSPLRAFYTYWMKK